MIRCFLFIFLFTSFIYAQNEINLDSLFDKFMALRSQQMVSSPESLKPTERKKCGFGTAAQVRLNFNRFTPAQRQILMKVMDRPILSNEYVSPYGHFKIHYDVSGTNKPAYENSRTVQQNVENIASILDSVYSVEVEQFGYPAPPPDVRAGGDNLYDIYIENQSSGYGYTQPENNITEETYTSYMSIDNDYTGGYYTKGISGAKVTIAHEMHHAIQLGNYALRSTNSGDNEDLFFFEMTSTAMEEFVYDYINDYYAYQKDYFNYPDKNFQGYKGYELAIWNIFLRDRFGIDIIKRQWELYSRQRAFSAINSSIADAGSSFKREMNLFGIWSYYTGYRKKIAIDNSLTGDSYGYFEEGDHYPLLRINSMTYSPGLFPLEMSAYPMSNNYLKIINTGSTPIIDTIVTIVTNGNFSALVNSPNSLYNVSYSLFDQEVEGTKKMVNEYFYKVEASDPDNYSEANIFNNKVVNGGEFLLTESDYAYPSPFYYKESRSEKIYIPVAYNRFGEAHLYIYSSDMNLIYEGAGKIITPNDKFVLEWNARDSEDKKLPSGVYLYVTESEDAIKKGKIVIFSE